MRSSERWMSGLSRTPGKRVYVAIRTVGSNPTLSAIICTPPACVAAFRRRDDMHRIVTYRRPNWNTQPDYLYPLYRSTVKRAPSKPLVLAPQTLTEVTGPLFGHDEVPSHDSDLTRQHAAEPIGERMYVSG